MWSHGLRSAFRPVSRQLALLPRSVDAARSGAAVAGAAGAGAGASSALVRRALSAAAVAGGRRFDVGGATPPLQPRSRCFSTLSSMRSRGSTKRKVTGRFGMDWFGGKRPTEINSQLPELPKEARPPAPKDLSFSRYDGIASGLGAEYFMREGQKHQLTYYHLRSPKLGGDTIYVGSTEQRAREARTIDNYIKEHTRGFAVQLILEGRGVKAYFEPKWPHLKVRLGVGAKVKDISQYCKRDPDCQVSVNGKGDVVVVHGPTKARVGSLAYRLLRVMQPILMPYTGKGAHFPGHPEKRKVVRKK
eukprot:TRINITY_DN2184_c0_g2_i1.p2 TRINITY_DN2184_c0_g2~~TRINITY_DN2184_c0_g2_i1.p2  ORF type:complete len:303 (+),score=68.48 TRINITY_DN2184_c0_g2_i1:98-1006(+)